MFESKVAQCPLKIYDKLFFVRSIGAWIDDDVGKLKGYEQLLNL